MPFSPLPTFLCTAMVGGTIAALMACMIVFICYMDCLLVQHMDCLRVFLEGYGVPASTSLKKSFNLALLVDCLYVNWC